MIFDLRSGLILDANILYNPCIQYTKYIQYTKPIYELEFFNVNITGSILLTKDGLKRVIRLLKKNVLSGSLCAGGIHSIHDSLNENREIKMYFGEHNMGNLFIKFQTDVSSNSITFHNSFQKNLLTFFQGILNES